MTEAELAIEEKLRKKRAEQEQIWQEYLEQREKERTKEEDDLRKLKERQVSRSQVPLCLQLVDWHSINLIAQHMTAFGNDSNAARLREPSRSG